MGNFEAKRIDHNALQPLSKNEKRNHDTLSKDSEVCKSNVEIFISNFRDYLLSTDVYECSSLLISENNWFFRKANVKCKGKDNVALPLFAGQLIQVDLGKDYEVESGLIHYGLILKVVKDKVLIIPMTTTPKQISVAFHPKKNPTGKFHLRRGLLSEGFTKSVALYINDIRCVSIGRLLPYKSVDKINVNTYNEIREHVLRYYFADMFKEYDNRVNQLTEENSKLRGIVNSIKEIVIDK